MLLKHGCDSFAKPPRRPGGSLVGAHARPRELCSEVLKQYLTKRVPLPLPQLLIVGGIATLSALI
jgi:hypothetical protein